MKSNMSKKFTPKKIEVNHIAYNIAIKQAEAKIENFKAALNFSYNNHVKETDLNDTAFNESFTQEFKRCFIKENANKVQLEIPYEKLLDLLSVNLDTLKELEYKHHENTAQLEIIDNETVASEVSIEDFTIYTRNESENKRLAAKENLVKALSEVSEFQKVYPLSVVQATSNFLLFDIAKNEYRLNRTIIPKH
jgi:mRNA-degrading endonuclease HigB of HigAB toxin-antitoxin module